MMRTYRKELRLRFSTLEHNYITKNVVFVRLCEPLYLDNSRGLDTFFSKSESARREKTYSAWIQKRVQGKKLAQIAQNMGLSNQRIQQLVVQGDRYEMYRHRWRERQGLVVAPASGDGWQGWVNEMLIAFADTFPSNTF